MTKWFPSRVVLMAGLWLGASLGSWAEAAPPTPNDPWGQRFLPASTEFYLELEPQLQLSQGPTVSERLRRSPLFRVITGALKMTPAQQGELASLPYWNGRFLFALVREGDLSPFERYSRAEEKARKLKDMRYAAEMAFEAVNEYRRTRKRFPARIEDLTAFDRELIPAGARFELRREGKKMSVRGELPIQGQEPMIAVWPDSQPAPASPSMAETGGMLIGLGCPDSQRLNAWLQRWDPDWEELAVEGDHWKVTIEQVDFHLVLHRNWIYLSNREELIRSFRAPSENTNSQSLLLNPRFQEQARRLQHPETELWGFVDIQDILQTSPTLCSSQGLAVEKILVRSVGVTSGATLDPGQGLEIVSRGFLQWDGVQNVTLGPAAASALGTRVPAGVEAVSWIDVPGWVRTADRLSGEFSGVSEAFAEAWKEAEERLGVKVPREALAAGCQIYLYTEAVDTYASQLEMLIQLVGGYLGEAGASLEEAMAFHASKVPVLVVAEFANGELAAQAQQRCKARLGANATSRTVEGVRYSLSEDGRCGSASSGTTQFWANGFTERLLPRVYSAYLGQGPVLSGSASYQRFMASREGELLAYQHAKVDREFSLLKALLLYLGSDFRPEAEILGRLRDAHTSLEVVAGGLFFRSTLYSEGVTPPPSPKTEEEQ